MRVLAKATWSFLVPQFRPVLKAIALGGKFSFRVATLKALVGLYSPLVATMRALEGLYSPLVVKLKAPTQVGKILLKISSW